jgi:hypothetical protein
MPGAEAVWSKNTVYEIQRFCGTNSVFPPQRGGKSGFAERPLTFLLIRLYFHTTTCVLLLSVKVIIWIF